MGMFDTLKAKLPANKRHIKKGIDKGADVIADKAGGNADKVEQGAEVAKDAVDKIPD